MRNHKDYADVFERLRTLSVQDPRAARVLLLQLFDSNDSALETVLQLAGGVGEGRIRQLIANTVRTRPYHQRPTSLLISWLATETDEFARRAIEASLTELKVNPPTVHKEFKIFDGAFVNAYRYASSRLKHEARNALLGPKAQILRLQTRLSAISDTTLRSELSALLGKLDDAFQAFGSTVDFEPLDEHFAFRNVELYQWIESMNRLYANRYSAIPLDFDLDPPGHSARIKANEYLLRIIFWNLWVNAHQAVKGSCRITIRAHRTLDAVELFVLDNGPGFPSSLREILFRFQYSTADHPQRGTGLLEVQEAVEQLKGEAQLVELSPNNCRIKLRFPLIRE